MLFPLSWSSVSLSFDLSASHRFQSLSSSQYKTAAKHKHVWKTFMQSRWIESQVSHDNRFTLNDIPVRSEISSLLCCCCLSIVVPWMANSYTEVKETPLLSCCADLINVQTFHQVRQITLTLILGWAFIILNIITVISTPTCPQQ